MRRCLRRWTRQRTRSSVVSDIHVSEGTSESISYGKDLSRSHLGRPAEVGSRGLAYYDAPAVRGITRGAESSDFRWSSIVIGIVKSAPFQMRRMPDAEAVNAQN